VLLSEKKNAKFRCRVHVKGYSPAIDHFVKLWCARCQQSSNVVSVEAASTSLCAACESQLTAEYLFVLRVEDLSGTIDVRVCFEDAERLFGVPALSALTDPHASNSVVSCIAKLLDVPNVDLCLKRYIDATGERRFRLFDTTLAI